MGGTYRVVVGGMVGRVGGGGGVRALQDRILDGTALRISLENEENDIGFT